MTLAKKIFAKDTFANLNKHITGEYNGHPNGTDLPAYVSTEFLLLGQDDKTAVVNLTIVDSTAQEFDTYLHFVKDDVWKVTAFRALAMTGMISQIKDMLENLTDAQVDSIVEHSLSDTLGVSMFKSRKEYEDELGKARLTLSSDKELIAHFKENEKKFEKLKNDLISKGILSTERGLKDMDKGNEFKDRLGELFINSVGPDIFYGSHANLNFNIGGMLDNSVGYLYIKDKENVPEMNPNRFIMIREIGNGWYLYKTT